MVRFRILFLSVFLCVLAFARPAAADVIRGRVVDPQSRPVSRGDVLIVLASSGNVIATATTNADGRFGPVTVPAGNYEVLISATG